MAFTLSIVARSPLLSFDVKLNANPRLYRSLLSGCNHLILCPAVYRCTFPATPPSFVSGRLSDGAARPFDVIDLCQDHDQLDVRLQSIVYEPEPLLQSAIQIRFQKETQIPTVLYLSLFLYIPSNMHRIVNMQRTFSSFQVYRGCLAPIIPVQCLQVLSLFAFSQCDSICVL